MDTTAAGLLVNDLDFVLLRFKHAPWLLHIFVCVSKSLVNIDFFIYSSMKVHLN